MDSAKYHLFIYHAQKKSLVTVSCVKVWNIASDHCVLFLASSNHAMGLLVPDVTLQIVGDVE